MKVRSILKFSDAARSKTGRPPPAREQKRRDERLRLAMSSVWPEIPRSRLSFERFHITDEATGELYTPVRGEVADANHSPAVAYYVAADGAVQFLERYAGARTRDELAAQRAARDQAAAARRKPKARR